MANWSLAFKNAGTQIKRGGQFGIETGLKMCPMTVVPYFGYKLLRYGRRGVLEGADIVYQITDTQADIMEGKIENFHTEPLPEQAEGYTALFWELGGYTESVDYYVPYMSRDNAKKIVQRMITKTLTSEDSNLLRRIEKGAVINTRKTVKDIIEDKLPSLPDIPSIPSLPSLPSLPDIPGAVGGIKRGLQVSALVLIGVILLIFYMLTGRGKKGVTVAT